MQLEHSAPEERERFVSKISTEDEIRSHLRLKYAQHFEHADAILEFAQNAMGSFTGKTGTARRTAMSLIFGRAYKSYYSILKLCEIAYTEDAGIVLRALFNLFVIARWILAKNCDERARKYLGWYWVVLRKIFDEHAAGIAVNPETNKWIFDEYQHHKKLFEYKVKGGNRRVAKKWYDLSCQCLSNPLVLVS